MTVLGDEITFDFTGTDRQARGNVNAVEAVTVSAVAFALSLSACYGDAPPPSEISTLEVQGEAVVAKGRSTRLRAEGALSDGSMRILTADVAWESADDAIASISNVPGSRGLVTAHREGQVLLTARFGALATSHALVVGPRALEAIEVLPARAVVASGLAVQLAAKNKMEFAMAVSYGSSLQVALFVAPVLVILGALLGQPMDLVFTPLEVAAVAAAVGISALIALDGESNWLEGALLTLVYIILAISFFEVR